MLMRLALAIGCVTGMAWVSVLAESPEAPVKRRVEHADFFRLEDVARHFGPSASVSADGRRVAFAVQRAAAGHVGWDRRYLADNDRSDVWVKLPEEPRARNLTNGLQDHSGWWSPAWSPDGRYLAMLSTRRESGIGEPTLWIWDSRENRLSQPVRKALEIHPHRASVEWLDSQTLIAMLRPGTDHDASGALATSIAALEAWKKAAEGRESTASVLDSGLPREEPDPQLALVTVSVRGETQLIAQPAIFGWQLSPDRRYMAYPVRTRRHVPPETDRYWSWGNSDIHTIDVSTIDGRKVLRTETSTRGLALNTLRWSAGSRFIAFLTDSPVLGAKHDLAVGDAREGTTKTIPLLGLETSRSSGLEWWGEAALLVRGSAAAGKRKDWWVVSSHGARRNLTADMPEVPAQLWHAGRGSFVGLAGGELWEIAPSGARVRRLTADFEPRIERVSWPFSRETQSKPRWREALAGGPALLLESFDGATTRQSRFDLRTYEIQPVGVPAGASELLACAPGCTTAVLHRSDAEGLSLWLANSQGSEPSLLFETNTFVREIETGEIRTFDYTSHDGEVLSAQLVLPVGFKAGQRYPLITSVYPGRLSSIVSKTERIEELDGVNRQLPAARGYAVLVPSFPLRRTRGGQDPLLDLQNAAMPAVEAVVRMGIADPERLYLIGISFGGFATFGLVTQTDRFAAAVAIAGASNLVSQYGQFDPVTRYSDSSMGQVRNPAILEEGAFSLGGPPSQDYWRYLRNSPILYVDRVNTPLMMVHGDLDFVALSQAEEFFTALYRQGKPARLVRYWGEDHIISSPANVVDMWERMLDWFEMHRKTPSAQAAQPRAHTSVLK